eukprot:scaffold860_cov111-Cylindrotheca_fusiformis.AAC.9
MTEFEDSYCDWCDRFTTNSRALVMGYNGVSGMGECICDSCLNKEKSSLYLVKHSGRAIFGKEDYYNQYWKNQSKIKVLLTPKDHQEIANQESEDELSAHAE